MSKKTLILCLCVVAALVVGLSTTLAYLTDTDTRVNTFTVGNVDITVEEEFEDDSPLFPGMQVNKDAELVNTGSNPAWVWMTVAVPAEADEYVDLIWASGVRPAFSENKTGEDGNEYVVYTLLVNEQLAPGATTGKLLDAVELDPSVDYQNGQYVSVVDGVVTPIDEDLSELDVIVTGYAVQTEGFTSAEAAYDAYYTQWGDDTIPTDETGTNVTPETAQDALDNAKPGERIYLTSGEYDSLVVKTNNVTIAGADDAIVGNINVNSKENVTIDGVVFDAAGAEATYSKKGATGYTASISGAINGANTGAKSLKIVNCEFSGTPANVDTYCPIHLEEQGRPTSRATDITIVGNTFDCDAFNYVRMNYLADGTATIKNNVFGGTAYSTGHNTMNFTGNAADLIITDNEIYNWNTEKNAIGSSRQGTNEIIVTVSNNLFSNSALVGEGGVIELKSSYTADNCVVNIAGNTYADGLAAYTDATAPIIKP